MVRQTGPEPQLWIGEACDLLGIKVRAGQVHVSRGIVLPVEVASGLGEKHTFGRMQVVQLAATKVLAEAGMPLEMIKTFFERLRSTQVHIDKLQTFRTNSHSKHHKLASPTWTGITSEAISFDLFPIGDDEVLGALTDHKARLYPPETLDDWPAFWSSVQQLVSPNRGKGSRIRQVLTPGTKLVAQYTQDERRDFVDWRRWATHRLSWGAFRLEGMREVSQAWLLDLASDKSRVGRKLLEEGWMIEGARSARSG